MMFTAASTPMWVALIALVSAVAVPLIGGIINRTNSRADAAEKFTRIAAGVADDYLACRDENAELRTLMRRTIMWLDRVTLTGNPADVKQAKKVIKEVRERTY